MHNMGPCHQPINSYATASTNYRVLLSEVHCCVLTLIIQELKWNRSRQGYINSTKRFDPFIFIIFIITLCMAAYTCCLYVGCTCFRWVCLHEQLVHHWTKGGDQWRESLSSHVSQSVGVGSGQVGLRWRACGMNRICWLLAKSQSGGVGADSP